MLTRRRLLHVFPGLPLLGRLGVRDEPLPSQVQDVVQSAERDYFNELGLRTFINAAGTYTALTASLMPEEVRSAIQYASRAYVRLDDIQDKAGARIAELLRCEAATVTSGAASALTLGTAGILSGMDEERVRQIPDLTGMKNEVILQTAHRIGYTHAIRNCGANIVYVETRQELERAINQNTALLLFINAYNYDGAVQDVEFVDIGRRHSIPTFNDCAADVPPVENLWKYTEMGFDLVAFSGGKGLRGPQSAGLLLGRRELIEAARLHAPPRGNTVGRGMKVNKEEILGMLVAVERYLQHDHDAEWQLWEAQIRLIQERAGAVAGVEAEYHVPRVANHVPSLRISWDESRIPIRPGEVREALRNGHPSIETVGGTESVDLTTWMMRPGEERVVAARIQQILREAAA